VAGEDPRFYEHGGIDLEGTIKGAVSTVATGTARGGSSISQQYVKNVQVQKCEALPDEKKRMSCYDTATETTPDRKLKEIIFALELTKRYSKEQILGWYVNQISYGGVYNGVEAAAQGYFGKPAKDLTLAEGAMLAGLPQSPAAYDPVNHPEAAMGRRNEVLDILAKQPRVQIGKETFFTPTPAEIEVARTGLCERQPLCVRREGPRIMARLPGQRLRLARPVSAGPEDAGVRAENETATVGTPHRVRKASVAESQPGHRIPLPIVDPDVGTGFTRAC